MDQMTQLRQNLGDDGDDPNFDDPTLQAFLDAAGGDVNKATLAGWKVLAARFAQLVDTTEGNAVKKFSQLHAQALAMVQAYEDAGSPTAGRSRCGRIRRPPAE